MQAREKAEKSWFTLFFQWFVAPEGQKVGSLKRRVRSHVVRWEMKSCMPLWRKAHFQVKTYKAHHVRTPFRSWHVEKVNAVVARSTFRSQKWKRLTGSEHFWKLSCRKSARRCGTRHISKSKVEKTDGFGTLLDVVKSKKCTPLWHEAHFEIKSEKNWGVRNTFGRCHVEKVHAVLARSTCRSQKCKKLRGFGALLEVEMSKKCTPLWRETHFEVKRVKKLTGSEHFWMFRCRFAWQAQGIMHLVKSEQNVRVLWHVPKRWWAWDICRESGKMSFAWQAQYTRHVHQSCSEVRALISWEGLHFGASDLQVCWDDFAWQVQVQHFVWLNITFSWQAQYFRQVEYRKPHWYEAVSSALNCPFLKEVSQNCFVFDVVNFKKEVSQNCFVFDVVKFENWGSLAELFWFWHCQVQKFKKSRRIVSYLTLSGSKIGEVSQNCFVFDVVKFKSWGSLAELFRFRRCQIQKLRKSRRLVSFSTLSSSKNWGTLAE